MTLRTICFSFLLPLWTKNSGDFPPSNEKWQGGGVSNGEQEQPIFRWKNFVLSLQITLFLHRSRKNTYLKHIPGFFTEKDLQAKNFDSKLLVFHHFVWKTTPLNSKLISQLHKKNTKKIFTGIKKNQFFGSFFSI